MTANIFLFLTNLQETNLLQFWASILFMSCSVALFLSATNHRWLFWGGSAVAVAYVLVSISHEGDMSLLSQASIVIGIIAGLLIIRSAVQTETGKQYVLPSPLDLLDKYPLTAAGLIEGACCVLIATNSILVSDYRLAFAAILWTIAHGFLIASDHALRNRYDRHTAKKI